MAQYKIAHIREQGIDLIVVPLERSFGMKTVEAQRAFVETLQRAAAEANLAGTVVPVWQTGNGHAFIAPPNWHAFFKSLGWDAVLRNVNRTLSFQ